ncbi:calcium:proton antiporter [Janibacter sp. G56]|uniref:calcium:proton antiporter n=1 Tax=Janibacter sp. G56 TaxID=3418717 RepID=UPI003CFCD9E7
MVDTSPRHPLLQWTSLAPVVGAVVLALTYPGKGLPTVVVALVALVLGSAVLAAVHHAEVIAHRVGEPFGSLVLAVAVTVIEVGLILMLMSSGGDDASALARDTVFAAVMITTNLIVGIALVIASRRHGTAVFNPEGTGAALATVIMVTGLCLVIPAFTIGDPGPRYTGAQLAFAAVSSLVLYLVYVLTQTQGHRDFFLPVDREHGGLLEDDHAEPPTARATWTSLALLLVSLVAVVGLAKVASPAIESTVRAAGLPNSFVGVVIALVVLAPETLAAAKAAGRDRVQTSLNLAYGSAMASVGLTIPVLAVATLFVDAPLDLGLAPTHLVLLAMTVALGILTVVPGRALRLHGSLHIVLGLAFVFLSMAP